MLSRPVILILMLLKILQWLLMLMMMMMMQMWIFTIDAAEVVVEVSALH
jgi:hypothetical protein